MISSKFNFNQLTLRVLEDNIFKTRPIFTRIYGLNFLSNKKSKNFDKRFGTPAKMHWPTMRIRRLERPARSKRKHISIVQKFNDCMLLYKMLSIINNFYFFGEKIKQRQDFFLNQHLIAGVYNSIRIRIGLPSKGQRTKTNARTCKKKRQITSDIDKLLLDISSHKSKELTFQARKLAKERAEMLKFRAIKDLMRQSRYRPRKPGLTTEEHYEKVYENVISAKKRRKNKFNTKHR